MFNKLSGKRFTSMSGDTLNIFHRKWMLWLVVFEYFNCEFEGLQWQSKDICHEN